MNKLFLSVISCFLIIVASSSYGQKMLSYADIWGNPQFVAKTPGELKSMKDGITYSNVDNSGNIIRYSFKTNKITDTLLFASALKVRDLSIEFSDYTFSNDESKILLTTETEQVYRHSTRASYFVYDRKSKTVMPVSEKGKQMYAQFSPDGKWVAFVRDNNLFIKNILSLTETAITYDGIKNAIINGATDWVYEEEFSFSQAYQWSPDGKYISFYRFDESRVKEFTLTYYDSLYPREERYKYPKAGEENATVEIYIYHIQDGKMVKAQIGDDKTQYIPRIKWTLNENQLCILRMNRYQNTLDYLLCDARSGNTRKMMSETSNRFIEINDDLTFLNNKAQFIYSSEKNGSNQLYLASLNGEKEVMLTSGADVMQFYGFDEITKMCYYQVAAPTPMERTIYTVTLDGKKKLISNAGGTSDATFSSNFNYAVITYSSIGVPFECYIQDKNQKKIRVLESNESVRKRLSEFNLSKPEFFNFKNQQQIALNGWMIKPPNFDPSKKYPVIVYVYGGPHVQTVLDRWSGSSFMWHQMLAQNGFIVVSVDNRGTPARGREFADCIYKDMGNYEVQDQIDLAKYLQTLSFVDAARIGVHGWSFGGYMTALLMTKGADYFKTGIAVAPVTNWRYYDTIYTERYLSLPQENAKGYDDNSPVYFADKLKGKFLLIHGLTDDNVHFQNSAELVKALIKNKKQFDSFYYPNQAHGISRSRGHVYEMMTEYFKKNL
jgi:dipeptidyl-peptidase-4